MENHLSGEANMSRRPGSKYFKGRVVYGNRVLRYVVWDGVRNYENAPPLQALAALEKMPGLQLNLRVDETAVEDIEYLITAPMDGCPDCGGLVVWTRDHRTYRLIVQRMAQSPQTWLQ
jgi:hypothetical protein